MAERPWGFWTESKLDMLSAYLPAFTTASKQRARSTVYLDLFAGQAANISRETGRAIEGSLLRALRTDPPFTVLRDYVAAPRDARRSVPSSHRAGGARSSSGSRPLARYDDNGKYLVSRADGSLFRPCDRREGTYG